MQTPANAIEVLESRRLLSAATLADGLLEVTGDLAATNQITVSLSADGTKVVVALGVNGGAPTTQEFDRALVHVVSVVGGDWRDVLLGQDGYDTIAGNGGRDVVNGGRGGDSLDGGAGDDVMHGSRGDDVMSGGAGLDRMFGNEGNDNMDGGDDTDAVFGGVGDDGVVGGAGKDWLFGGSGTDVLTADADDVLRERGPDVA